ncbi:YibL family ribosome-associated protein [Vibrio algarum]|uniref:YibL family ribosome-associated protein n=1 Tax=Vibrio algarum TaxID=3020714 RepID=A0ABT4YVN7_9VIBR|nr:YibL family ribosome-associated protein [Vibrio sp. KJ40-1]MDB1125645.1 YibL family ribosome-associated protein [Vibrio sp. KJ40-1]
MSVKKEIQQLNNRLDKCKNKLSAAVSRRDQPVIAQFDKEIEQLNKKLNQLKHKESYDLNKERKILLDMPFQRELSKEEQADLGQLKKKVKGIVVVHPLTKIGKELRLEVVTGFAPKEF